MVKDTVVDKKESVRIIISADICVTDNNKDCFRERKIECVVDNEIIDILDQVDYRIFNIEAPVTDTKASISKRGPCLRMDENVMPGLMALKPSVVTLANNHIADQGQDGIKNTIRLFEENGVKCVGAGSDIDQASELCFLEKYGIKIGIYACAEHEFSIYKKGYSANPYDPATIAKKIIKAKQNCDYLVVLYHGGRECYCYPTPELQKSFQGMAECGADVVIAQHTHCVGCFEKYDGAYLIYGQGNFIFDRVDDEYWNSGLLLDIGFSRYGIEVQFIPFVKENGKILLARGEKNSYVMDGFKKRTEEITNPQNIEERYSECVKGYFENTLRILHGNSFLFRVVNRIMNGGLIYKVYRKKDLLAILNMIECESHREILIAGLKQEIQQRS